MKRKVDRSWFESETDTAVVQLRTRAVLARSFDKRAEEARSRIAEEKRRTEVRAKQPVRLAKMHPIAYWSEFLGFSPDTIREWCKTSKVHGQWLRGEWRITEPAMQEFLEKENQKHARQG